MATIHMEVESVRNVAASISSSKEDLSTTLLSLNSQIHSMVGSAWVSPSANEFQNSFQEWASNMRQLMEQLATIEQRLNTEINEFEQTAAKLS